MEKKIDPEKKDSKMSRREFIKNMTIYTIIGAILLSLKGARWIDKKRNKKLEQQILEGRIIGIPKKILNTLLGEKNIKKSGLVFYDDILRIDTAHLRRIDQGYNLWRNIQKLENKETNEITIPLHNQRTKKTLPLFSPEKVKNTSYYKITKQDKDSIINNEILQELFYDISLQFLNLTEEQQWENYITRIGGVTAGVVTDTNANYLGTMIAIQKGESIQKIYNFAEKKQYAIDFRDKNVIQLIFGNNFLQGEKALKEARKIWRELKEIQEIKTFSLDNTTKYPGLHIEEKIIIEQT